MKNVLRLAVVGSLFMTMAAWAQTIVVDELGNGRPHLIGQDPGPDGQTNVLIYQLPFSGVQGDVLMLEMLNDPESPYGATNDLIRFNGDGTMVFYSFATNVLDIDALADVLVMPLEYYPNSTIIQEVGDEIVNWADYTPLPGQPGYDPSNPSYRFYSDVPEPSTVALVATLGGLALVAHRRRNK
jgi:hypothetical protein